MRKSTIIAQCLVNSKMKESMEDAEHDVRQIFRDGYPEKDFDIWNVDMHEETGNEIIKGVGKASRINVKNFIEDLS